MKMRHGAIALEVPADWTDRSTLLFVGPPLESGSSEAISMVFVESGEPEEALERQAEEIRELDPKLQILARERFEGKLGSGRCLLQRYLMNGIPVRQLVVALPLPSGGLVIATAATTEARFIKEEAALRRILSSLEPAK
jgi:hypothetical protein